MEKHICSMVGGRTTISQLCSSRGRDAVPEVGAVTSLTSNARSSSCVHRSLTTRSERFAAPVAKASYPEKLSSNDQYTSCGRSPSISASGAVACSTRGRPSSSIRALMKFGASPSSASM